MAPLAPCRPRLATCLGGRAFDARCGDRYAPTNARRDGIYVPSTCFSGRVWDIECAEHQPPSPTPGYFFWAAWDAPAVNFLRSSLFVLVALGISRIIREVTIQIRPSSHPPPSTPPHCFFVAWQKDEEDQSRISPLTFPLCAFSRIHIPAPLRPAAAPVDLDGLQPRRLPRRPACRPAAACAHRPRGNPRARAPARSPDYSSCHARLRHSTATPPGRRRRARNLGQPLHPHPAPRIFSIRARSPRGRATCPRKTGRVGPRR